MHNLGRALRRLTAALVDVLRGATGTDAYARYCSHMGRAHPEALRLDRASFFREREAARWHGVRRCC